MRNLIIAAVAATAFAAFIPASGQAAQVRLDYQGQDLICVSASHCSLGSTVSGFTGTWVIDETALGGSIANQTLGFSWFGSPFPAWFVSESNSYFSIPTSLFGSVSFSFDANRSVTSWAIDVGDGPPDFVSATAGDAIFTSVNSIYNSEGPGSWRTTVVPLPAPAGLLLLGLGLLGFARRSS